MSPTYYEMHPQNKMDYKWTERLKDGKKHNKANYVKGEWENLGG